MVLKFVSHIRMSRSQKPGNWKCNENCLKSNCLFVADVKSEAYHNWIFQKFQTDFKVENLKIFGYHFGKRFKDLHFPICQNFAKKKNSYKFVHRLKQN